MKCVSYEFYKIFKNAFLYANGSECNKTLKALNASFYQQVCKNCMCDSFLFLWKL